VIVVSDSSPLLNLAIIGQLNLLQQLYGSVIIPQAVHEELVVKGAGMPGAESIGTASWIVVEEAMDRVLVAALQTQLDFGEAEAIVLAIESSADLLLLDERKARTVAAHLKLRFTGLLGLLVEAKQKNYIVAIKPVLDALMNQARFWVSPELYKHVLEQVGESTA
jgi:hypothetical protein